MARESDAIPLVSVVIPTLNRSILLGRAIDTVLAQTYRRVEVVVVDDGSSDGTSQRVAQIGDQRVRYVRHPRTRGLAAARNTGIRHARGQYVALLDDDDEIVAEKLERQLAALHESADPAATVCYTRVIFTQEGGGAARSHIYPGGHNAFWFAIVNQAPDAVFYEG